MTKKVCKSTQSPHGGHDSQGSYSSRYNLQAKDESGLDQTSEFGRFGLHPTSTAFGGAQTTDKENDDIHTYEFDGIEEPEFSGFHVANPFASFGSKADFEPKKS